MNSTLAHRGPDDEGVWTSADGSVALAQRRLSIIDLSPLGRNPMPWDGGRLWITFNGEIYNFRELRLDLEAAGYRFRSQTDTEAILAAYDRWGVECLDRLVGMFAFAIWDEPKKRLWVVRDRLGKKPLYYADSNGAFRFASELKAIVADPSFERDIDPEAIRFYLRYGYIPSPSTIYRGARKLPPGHFLLVENGRTTVTRYWDPVQHALRIQPKTDADAIRELEDRLSTAVRQRMIADVPLGAFLSGGIGGWVVVGVV
jgi:asparagine synthase (glutamine-hydrolysing)